MTIEEQTVNDWSEKTYLNWVNNYLTIEKMSQDYNMSEKAMRAVIYYGREIHLKKIQ